MPRLRVQQVTTAVLAIVVSGLSLAACSSSGSGGSGGSSGPSGTLNASGSSFQLLFQQAAIQQFRTIQPNVTVNYGGGGSGKGRSDLAAGTVNFPGSDSPIPPPAPPHFPLQPILHFPALTLPL